MRIEGSALEAEAAGVVELPEAALARKGRRPLALVSALCDSLDREGIRYCHWKSNEALDRSATGENDLDLLVHRADSRRFEAVLAGLGFRDAQPPGWKRIPGIYHAYAPDASTGVLAHVHAHYQLVVGDDMTKSYRLPIEDAYLASAVPAGPFMIPAPELELSVLVLRMVLKHCPLDSILSAQGSLTASERRELIDLTSRVDPERAWEIMGAHLPFVPVELWRRCLRALEPGASMAFRVGTARRLHGALAACIRRRPAADTYLKVWRRARTILRRKVLRRGPITRTLSAGGLLIGVVGGDGAGKTTVVEDLSEWLSREISVLTVHLGKPRRSASSTLVKGAMSLASAATRSPAPSPAALRRSLPSARRMDLRTLARLSWVVLTARDRYRAYRLARRAATNGAVVVCDRYPLPEITLMDGSMTAVLEDPGRHGRFVGLLAARERAYYERITYPDLLVVLRVDPDVAVARRLGVDDESVLRPRSEEIGRIDWSDPRAVVVDAGRPKAEVLAEVRSIVWSRL
jgi:thymidylate kinase